MERAIARAGLFLAGLAFYWGGIPFVLLIAGERIGLKSIPAWIGAPFGGSLIALGGLGAVWCTVTIYLRGGGFPIAFMPPKRLVQAGPYGFSRHPLYISFLLYLLGLGLVFRSAGTVVLIPGIGIVIALYARFHEERALERKFGAEYAAYRRVVPFGFRYRRGVPGPGLLFALVYLVGKPILRALFPTRVQGKENLPQTGPALLIANHSSYLDPLFIFAAADRYIRFLAKSELMRSGFGRWFFTRTGTIPTSRYRVDPGAVRGLLSALQAGEIVGIFPEGERTWDGNPLPVPSQVRRILARAGVPIIPVRITGGYVIYPRWADYPLPGPLTVEFFPPLPPPHTAADIDKALSCIAAQATGMTLFPRSARGIELVLWACPHCHEIGVIEPHRRNVCCRKCGAEWRLDRKLRLHPRTGAPVTIGALSASIPVDEIIENRESLNSIGEVDVFTGNGALEPVGTGTVMYRAGEIRLDGTAFPLADARILRMEGKDRLDIGFSGGRRLRLRFHRDSPLKWALFLERKLGRKA